MMAMGNSKDIVKILKIGAIDAAKYLNKIWVQRLSKGYNKNNRVEYTVVEMEGTILSIMYIVKI